MVMAEAGLLQDIRTTLCVFDLEDHLLLEAIKVVLEGARDGLVEIT